MNAHDHHHSHIRSSNQFAVAFFINLIFTIIEIIGGIMTNSLAILSDALHDLGDSLSLALAWFLEKVSDKGRDQTFTYGYKRFSLLGAVINGIILCTGSIFLIYNAIPRLLAPQETLPEGMLALALLGVIFNTIAYKRLQHGHSHNVKVASLHLLEDVLGWVAVLIGSIVIYFTEWYIIDPLLSIGIALFILYNVFRNLTTSWSVILQGIPSHIVVGDVEKVIKQIPGVNSYHDLHIWSLDGIHGILTVHLVVDEDLNQEKMIAIKRETERRMQDLQIDHCTIEIEFPDEDCQLMEH